MVPRLTMNSTNFQINPSILSEAFRNRLEDHLFTDLLIRTADGREVPAHRLILAAVSPILNEALLELDREPAVSIILPDFTWEEVHTLLPYLYGGCNKKWPQPNADLLECLQIGVWGDNWPDESELETVCNGQDESESQTFCIDQHFDKELYPAEVEAEEKRRIKSEMKGCVGASAPEEVTEAEAKCGGRFDHLSC